MPPENPYVRSGRYAALAFDFTGTIMAGALVGWLVDGQFGTGPYGVTAVTLIAVVGGFARLLVELRRLDRRRNAG